MTNDKQIRNPKSEIDMTPLKVKTSKLQIILVCFLGLFFAPIGLWAVSRAVTSGFKLVPTVISILMFGSLAIVGFLFFRGMKMLPKALDREGITRRDGQRFPWSELIEVEHQYHIPRHSGNQKSIWRIEIRFRSGTVWLLPLKIVNFVEIYQFVRTLPCPHTEKNWGQTGI